MDWKVSETQDKIPPCVERVAVESGNAIIFTEALAQCVCANNGVRTLSG